MNNILNRFCFLEFTADKSVLLEILNRIGERDFKEFILRTWPQVDEDGAEFLRQFFKIDMA